MARAQGVDVLAVSASSQWSESRAWLEGRIGRRLTWRELLRSQLLQRVMLFAPEVGGGAIGWRQQRPQLRELSKRLESAAAQLVALGKSHAAA